MSQSIVLNVEPAAAALASRLLKMMAPPPKLTVSEWADTYRVLGSKESAEPGKWRTSRAEYFRGVMDEFTNPRTETIVIMTSAQVGKSECGLCLIGYHIHRDPAKMLVVCPTVEDGEKWSKGKFQSMITDTPVLRELLPPEKSRSKSSTIKSKEFPGGELHIVGANSPSGLAALSIRVLVCDEVDRFPQSAGREGDPVSLARKRTTTFWNRKIVLISTPTDQGGSRIEKAYQTSDQRRFWVPCHACGEKQILRWPHVKWDLEDETTARYECAHCGAAWNDAQRWAAVRQGEWRAERPFKGTAGFHLSELYSSFVKLSSTVRNFLEAKDNVEELKTWVNTALGEVWQESGSVPDWERLLERRERFPMGTVPAGVFLLTAGIDAQRDRLEMYVWGWGAGYESWLIDSHVFHGSPATEEPWIALAKIMERQFPCIDGTTMQISVACCDTGGQDTESIYGHIRRMGNPRLLGVKGVDSWNKSQLFDGPTYVDTKLDGKKIRRGLAIWTVAVSHYKSAIYQRLSLSRRDGIGYPPGWVHLPEGVNSEQVKQLVAEELITPKGKTGARKPQWKKLRDRNEALDCFVYARAALSYLGADKRGDSFWTEEMIGRGPVVEPGAAPVEDETEDDAPVRPAPMQVRPRPSYLQRIGRG